MRREGDGPGDGSRCGPGISGEGIHGEPALKTKLAISLIFLLALVHLALVAPAIAHPERFLNTDSDQYIDLATNLARHGSFTSQVYPEIDLFRTPAYPAFLAIVQLVFGDVRWASLVQVLVVLLNCVILYRIGADLKWRSVGVAAVLLYLLSLNTAFEALNILTETFTSFWLLLALWALVRFWLDERAAWLVLSGLSLGVATLARPIVEPLFFIWCLFLFLLWGWRQRKFTVRWKDLRNLLIFGLSGLVLILGWQVRNLAVHHRFTLATVGQITLQNYIVAMPMAEVDHISLDQARNLIAASPNPDTYMLNFILAHPLPFLKTQVRGILLTLVSVDYPTWANDLTGITPAETGVMASMSFSFSTLMDSLRSGNLWILAGLAAVLYDLVLYALAVYAAVLVLVRQRGSLVFQLVLLLLLVSLYMIITPLVQGSGRFRIPVEPYLALLAGLAFIPRAGQPEGHEGSRGH
jgi:4-amino-4-deoxy-L-arabinose transferase-like glycosyltransferase